MSLLHVGEEQEVYLGAVIDIIKMIKNEAYKQYTGEFSSKVIFTENIGFKTLDRGEQFEAEFQLYDHKKQEIINNILDNKAGYLLHKLPKSSFVYMTSYQPFKLFQERFGLLFVHSENDFVARIKAKLQIIFLSFFAMIGLVMVVLLLALRTLAKIMRNCIKVKRVYLKPLLSSGLCWNMETLFPLLLTKRAYLYM